jgi:hypothetical protein
MNISSIICSFTAIRDQLIPVIRDEFSITERIATEIFDNRLNPHFRRLKPTVYFLIEYPYVDRVYRDSYYSYFSSKQGNYGRDCVRLSLFDGEILPEQLRGDVDMSDIGQRYLGFMVLRPTIPYIVGRNVLSPRALQQDKFLSVGSIFQATVSCIKFQITGFPHSSQDSETISCAETSVWAIMEYFSSKYVEYKPALPSVIINALRSRSNFRQIPSEGLNIEQMGYALREFGFGTKIYSKDMYGDPVFKNLLSTYIASGLPLIVAISNRHLSGRIGHAVLAVGQSITTDDQIDNLSLIPETEPMALLKASNIQLLDNDNIERDFVFVDDNHPVYQLAPLKDPVKHYQSRDWTGCQVTHFIVPLYPKIYLDAYVAKKYIKTLLFENRFSIPGKTELFLRIYLTSSRSYKEYLAKDTSHNSDFRNLILEKPMPKFIWVGEISTKTLIKQKKANGLIIIDATEPNLMNFKPLIVSGYIDIFYYPDSKSRELIKNQLPLGEFFIFKNNLKGF